MNGFPYNLVAWKSFKQKGKIDEFYFHKNFCMAKKTHQRSKRENFKKISNQWQELQNILNNFENFEIF